MKKSAIFLLAGMATLATAQINAFKVENLWNNSTGTFTSGGTFPVCNMTCANQNNTANNTYGERFVAWLSADSAATRAKINGHADFSFFWNVTLSTDAAAVREVECGLLLQYQSRGTFAPTSQIYAKFRNPGITTAIQTSGDWVMPSYDFIQSHNAEIFNGVPVLMGLEYDWDPNGDGNGADSVQRLTFGAYQSPWLNGNWGGAMYDAQMEIGPYFQPLVEAANPTHTSHMDINLVSFSGTVIGAPGATVSGNVVLDGWTGAVNGRSVNFTIYNGTTSVGTATATLNSSGNYSFTTNVPNGTYTMIANANRAWLKKKTTMTIAGGAATNVNFTVKNGDCNDDTLVDIADYTLLALAFDATPTSGNWNVQADLNGDEIVDIADYTILALAFDMVDDTP